MNQFLPGRFSKPECLLNWLFSARIGQLIGKMGERTILRFEYLGLTIVFMSVGLVEKTTIAAMIIPALLGMLWIVKPAWVFYIGAGFAFCSLFLTTLIPDKPKIGLETRLSNS